MPINLCCLKYYQEVIYLRCYIQAVSLKVQNVVTFELNNYTIIDSVMLF